MLLFLLSLGGIPFVAGFWAKLYVFWAAAAAGLYWLVLVGAILTVVALFYYLLVAKRMYIEAPGAAGRRIPVAPTLVISLLLCVLGVVVLGVYPKPLVMAALRVAAPLFSEGARSLRRSSRADGAPSARHDPPAAPALELLSAGFHDGRVRGIRVAVIAPQTSSPDTVA